MILMPVGDDDPFDLFPILDEIGDIRDDVIDTKHVVLGKHQTRVHH